MDDSVEASAANPEAGKADWQQWETSPMRKLRERGDGMNLVREQSRPRTNLRARVEEELRAIRQKCPSWNRYDCKIQDGIKILELARTAIAADWRSTLFRTKLLTAILADELRAHEQGGFEKAECGAWVACSESLAPAAIERLEEAFKTAMALIGKNHEGLDAAAESNGIAAFIAGTFEEPVIALGANGGAEVAVGPLFGAAAAAGDAANDNEISAGDNQSNSGDLQAAVAAGPAPGAIAEDGDASGGEADESDASTEEADVEMGGDGEDSEAPTEPFDGLGDGFLAERDQWLEAADKILASPARKGWSKRVLKAISDILPQCSKNNVQMYKDFCKWAFTPMPKSNGVVAFNDCLLEFGPRGVRQVRRAEAADCYLHIPESLVYAPSDEFQEWFRKFFTTTIAGDTDCMELEFGVESLAVRGLWLPHHCIVYFGGGGNAKGARSRLRARCYGTGHKWVPPQVFDKAVRDEFRKQGAEFYGAMLCTIREADAFDFDEKVFRSWSAGEGLGCRLPHAVHTPLLDWMTCGKFWEMNPLSTPRMPSIVERSMRRRFIGIEKVCLFTTDPSEVDCGAKVFEAEEDLESKIESGDAVWCYFRNYLIPWQQDHTPEDARRLITRLAPSLQESTRKLHQIFIENQTS